MFDFQCSVFSQGSRGRKSAGVSSPGCRPHAKTRRREEEYTRSVVTAIRPAADGSLRVGILQAAGLTRRREDAKKNTQGESSVAGGQASRGRKHTGANHSRPSRGRIRR